MGGVLAMTMLSLSEFPSSIPSFPVTVQTTVSPCEKAPESVLPTPAGSPLTVHSKVELSESPSASVKV